LEEALLLMLLISGCSCGYSLKLSAAPGDFSPPASWVSISRSL
jgi:hypothetical protein